MESYENCEIYENCKICNNCQDHRQNSRGSKEGPSKVTKTANFTKFRKTAKFAIIVKTTDEIYEIYSRGSKEGPSKVTKTAKITKTATFAFSRPSTKSTMKYISPSTQNKVKLLFKLFAYFLEGYARSFRHKLSPIHDIS